MWLLYPIICAGGGGGGGGGEGGETPVNKLNCNGPIFITASGDSQLLIFAKVSF